MTAEARAGAGRRCAVLGSPIEHSLSPALHAAAYAELGLTGWSYGRAEVGAGGLAGFVGSLDGTWRGLSLTMPLKAEVLGLPGLEVVSDAARLTGVGNTLLLGSRREVHNTDVAGLVWALDRALQDRTLQDRARQDRGRRDRARQDRARGPGIRSATVLGSGATARSALVALAKLGAGQAQVLARDPAKARALQPLTDALGLELVVPAWGSAPPDADVVVSTVVAGALDDWVEDVAGSAGVVFDVVYDPWPTTLARAAARAGAAVVDGLDLLVGQAVLQVELMTGRRPSPGVLRAAGESTLSARNDGPTLSAP